MPMPPLSTHSFHSSSVVFAKWHAFVEQSHAEFRARLQSIVLGSECPATVLYPVCDGSLATNHERDDFLNRQPY